jgi:radical SAM protein with 4Fe4S-binding SPASM domain
MTTNALQLAKQADDLIESGLNEICISLDGPPAIHNAIRGNKQSFEKALEGIEKIFSHPKSKLKVSVFCAITEWNIGYFKEFLDYFQKFPLQQIGFMHTVFNTEAQASEHNQLFGDTYFATASNMEEINLNKYDLTKLAAEIQEIQQSQYNFPVLFQPKLSSHQDLENYYHHPEIKFGKKCMDLFHHLMIKSDGSVIPAHSRCYTVTAGNIYEQSLPEIWNSETVKKFRKDLVQAGGLFPSCTRCCSGFAG